MPELPEVEAVRRLLVRRAAGARIRDVSVVAPKVLKGSEPPAFASALRGAVIDRVDRRGKYLLLRIKRTPLSLDKEEGDGALGVEYDLVVHLSMRGWVRVEPADQSPGKYYCLELTLDNGSAIRYYDVWQWGEFSLYPDRSAERSIPALARMGPEPDDPAFTAGHLAASLRGRKALVKPALLSQQVVAGIGNIYADECLNRAGLHPGRLCNGLTENEVSSLHHAIREVIAEAVERGGAAVERIADARENLDDLNEVYVPRVYDRAGQPCPKCGRPLSKYKLQGRGTTFCPHCQPDAAAAPYGP